MPDPDSSHSAAPPDWLAQFSDQVAAQLLPVDSLAPIGCHYFFDLFEQAWEVTLFVSRTEVIGGNFDGRLRPSRFRLDVLALLPLFEQVHEVYWQAQGLGAEDELGPHVSIEGVVAGESVWLRIPSIGPSRFEPGRKAIVNEAAFKDLW